MNANRYLERIGMTSSDVSHTYEFLKALQHNHICTVPYENLDILNDVPIDLSKEALFENIVTNRRGVIRYGITTGKKVGCAVMRNRARRVIAAALRECLPDVKCAGADIVFVARSKTPFVKSTDIASEMKGHFKSGGIISHEER